MKKSLLFATAAAFTAFASLSFALENMAPSLPMSKLLQNINNKGYTIVDEIKWDNGNYRANAVDRDGRTINLLINPHNGKLSRLDSASGRPISMLQAVKKAEASGFRQITKVESVRSKYEIKGLDARGRTVELDVNKFSGNMNLN